MLLYFITLKGGKIIVDTHKNRLGTRLISLFLALMLSLSLFSLPVFAEGEQIGGDGEGTVEGGDQSGEHGGTGGDSHAGIGAYGEGGWFIKGLEDIADNQ